MILSLTNFAVTIYWTACRRYPQQAALAADTNATPMRPVNLPHPGAAALSFQIANS